MWSTAAFEGAQIIIFLLSPLRFRYSNCADSSPMRVDVLPVPGGPCSITMPFYRRTISRIDSHCVWLKMTCRPLRMSLRTYFLLTYAPISRSISRGSRITGAKSEKGMWVTAWYSL